jgi:ubiquinone/menaquinone biosynthesis C-methylase UbiE
MSATFAAPAEPEPASVSDAYSTTGEAWQLGPGRIYDRLAETLVRGCPVPVAGASVLDVGAGTGAGTRAVLAAGAARVVAADSAWGMLRFDADGRPPAVVADALHVPFVADGFDLVIAFFALNHVTDPTAGLREAARVLRAGGGLVVSAYAEDDTHPVKAAVESAAAERGWQPAGWYRTVREEAVPRLATVERAAAAAEATGLTGVEVQPRRVPFPDLTAGDLVAWRLGMAQLAPFVATLSPDARAELAADAEARLGSSPPALVRSLVVLTAVA